MIPEAIAHNARHALNAADWETRYAALEVLSSRADHSDIPDITHCLHDSAAPVRTLALQTLQILLAFEAEPEIKKCLFDNDPQDPYGSLEVRTAARHALDSILRHTRPTEESFALSANY